MDATTTMKPAARGDALDVLRGLTIMLVRFAILVVCHRKRWILKL